MATTLFNTVRWLARTRL